MDNEFKERTGFSGAVATTINYTGMGLVYAYDYTALAFKGLFKLAKKTTKIKKLFTTSDGDKRLDEYQHIQNRIDKYENRIKSLYYEIGRLGAQNADEQKPIDNDDIKKLLDDVKDYEKEIKRLDNRLSEIREGKSIHEQSQKDKAQPDTKEKSEQENYDDLFKHLQSIIDTQIKKEKFETQSEHEIFSKVANDLLDQDPEIQVLAAAELGKMAHPGAIPILMEATKLNQPELTNEIINALIRFKDERSVLVFKNEMTNPRFSVRIGCIRGIYKLGEDHDIVTILSEALRDKHSEVRRTAATFLGWRDKSDVVPALVQCLKDENESVRRATVDALSNIKDPSSVLPLIKLLADEKLDIRERAFGAIRLITGEKVNFDLHLTGSKLKDEIDNLRDWWQEFRMQKKKAELSDDDLDAIEEMDDTPDIYEEDEDIQVSDTLDTGESSESEDVSEESDDIDDSKEDVEKDTEEETSDEDQASEDEIAASDEASQQDSLEDKPVDEEGSEEQTIEDAPSEEESAEEDSAAEAPSDETASEEVADDDASEKEAPETEADTQDSPVDQDSEADSTDESSETETTETEEPDTQDSPVDQDAEAASADESNEGEISAEEPEATDQNENEEAEPEATDQSENEEAVPEDSSKEDTDTQDSNENR